MAAKLSLTPAPTFRAKVEIPVAGGNPAPVEFTFKHRTKSALDKFMNSRTGASDVDSVMDMVEGWDLAEPFDRAGVEALLENYAGAALALYVGYVDELLQAKRKN
jgi:hypothetical protein